MEDYRALARKRAAERRTSIWYKLEGSAEGVDNTFRILPTPATRKPPEGADKKAVAEYKKHRTQGLFYEYKLHREVGKKKLQLRCGQHLVIEDTGSTWQGDCWICDVLIPKLQRSGRINTAEALKAQDVLALQVAKVIQEDEDTPPVFQGPFIFTPSKKVGDQILSSVIGSKKKSYTDAKKGYNITINRIGTTKNDTQYGMLSPDHEPTEVPASIIKKLLPFSALKEIPVYDEAKQKAAWSGTDVVEDEEDEEELEELVSKPRKKSKPEPEEDEDEEEESEESEDEDDESDEDEDTDSEGDDIVEDEDETEEEEEEEEKPKPKKKSKPEPEDESEEEEEEPEEKPKPKKKAKAEPEEDEEEESEEEEEKPAKKAPPTKKGKAKPEPEEEDEDDLPDLDDIEDTDEESEEEEEPVRPKAKSKKPVAPPPKKKK